VLSLNLASVETSADWAALRHIIYFRFPKFARRELVDEKFISLPRGRVRGEEAEVGFLGSEGALLNALWLTVGRLIFFLLNPERLPKDLPNLAESVICLMLTG
jgi:hypothetical protein